MKKLIALSALVLAFSVNAETVVVEAESFADWGGWVNDTQFMDQMGSPYLLAHGLGKPVADAKTTFVAKGGKYRIYVRTMNWTARWSDEAAGLFQVMVDRAPVDRDDGKPFGTGGAEWGWQKSGVVDIAAGGHTIALHDLTGFDGRVDAIVFTTEEDPSSVLNGPRHPSVVVNRAPLQKFDLCVVGGGIAGISAAVSAARLGLKVALVHDRPILGGNNSSEVRVHLGGYQNLPPYPRLGDVLAEFGPKEGGNARHAANYEDDRKLAIVKAEKNITLFLNEHVNGVEKLDSNRISAVRSVNTRTGVATQIVAALYADCTGDGTLGYLAGADYRMGREAKSETNEPDAPEKADMITMGASVQWYAGDAKGDAAFPTRPWMLKSFTDENCSPHLRGDWWWEAGLGRDQIREGEYIRDYGLLVAFSNWAYVKNTYAKKGDFADKELKWVAYNAGRRESRRLLGDFILDQNHLRSKDFQSDGTCVTTWTIDLHLPKTEEETKFKGESYQSNSLNEKVWPYPIPYRCLYSRNIPNLFMAGRDISVTHVALGTTRLMRTHGMQGEVVGMAAAVCRRRYCLPREVYKTHFADLKALMTKGVGDGRKHPRQDYNCQESLDPDIKKNYSEAVKGLVEEPAARNGQMMTTWGEKVTPENAWRSYPRPQMVREQWVNLNGKWDYAVTSVTNTPGIPEKWDGKILVPFPIESALSGVGRLLRPDEFLWYTRKIECDPKPGERILLHFGGVDFRTMVFIGHQEVTDVPHEGGQNPFSLDITDFVRRGENTLTVCVWDPTEDFVNSRGKQSFKPSGCFYTRVSGIWQTVWMETVPEKHIKSYKLFADIDKGTVRFEFDKVEGAGEVEVTTDLPRDFDCWSPENPRLYSFTAKYGKDVVRGKFGMRKIEKRRDSKGVLRFFLNNKPYFPIGTLDQGWWPDGLLTPPSEEAMEYDVKVLKDCGFNMLRKHIKVEPQQYYAMCDRLGILVIQDLPSGSGNPFDPMKPETVKRYWLQRQEMKEMMDDLQPFTSIVMWNPYNEGWTQPGEFLTHAMLDFTKRHDPTRLVNGPSGCWDWEGGHLLPKGWNWNDRVLTRHKPEGICEAADTVDMHLYRGPTMFPVNDRRISFLGEFGGLGHPVSGHLWKESKDGNGSWGYGGIEDTKTREGLEKTYLALMAKLGDLAEQGLGGSIYTQTTDVEIEINGILTYDRKVLKYNPEVLKKAHEEVVRRISDK